MCCAADGCPSAALLCYGFSPKSGIASNRRCSPRHGSWMQQENSIGSVRSSREPCCGRPPADTLWRQTVPGSGGSAPYAGECGRDCTPRRKRQVNSSRAFLTPDRSRFTTYTLFSAVFPQKVFPVPDSGKPMNHGYVFLYHSAVLHCLGQGGGSLFCAGVNHDAAHFVKPVDGENLPRPAFSTLREPALRNPAPRA